jgi:hypothetical protein
VAGGVISPPDPLPEDHLLIERFVIIIFLSFTFVAQTSLIVPDLGEANVNIYSVAEFESFLVSIRVSSTYTDRVALVEFEEVVAEMVLIAPT